MGTAQMPFSFILAVNLVNVFCHLFLCLQKANGIVDLELLDALLSWLQDGKETTVSN